MASKDFFIRQLQKLPPDRRLEIHGAVAKICCPFHGGGKERTPSLIINLERNGTYKPGSAYCFGCSDKVEEWDTLAKELKLAKIGNNTDHDASISQDLKKSLFGNPKSVNDFEEGNQIDPMVEFMPLWPKNQEWRTISGKILHRLKARLIPTEYGGSQLYLPVYVRGKFFGGIKARLKKIEGLPSYFNDKGNWISNVLYPFDYTQKLLAKQKRRVLFICEGPRDVLNPLQYNIPTVANLGGKTVWTKQKARLLLDLEPDLVIIATDDDIIGHQTAEIIAKDIKGQCETKRLKFPTAKNGQKMDPGSTSKKRWLELKDKLGII